jgi:deazaflavin-dependent oxidoreductase (nitroreductase family)
MRRRIWILTGLGASGLLVALLAVGLHDMTNLFAGSAGEERANASGRLRDRLAAIADRSVMELTHYGRKSGTPYQVTTWFAVDGETVYVPTSDGGQQWTRNVQHTPRLQLRFGSQTFEGTVTPVTDDTQKHHVYELLRRKYWTIRLMGGAASLFGHDPSREPLDLGRGGFYRVELTPLQ